MPRKAARIPLSAYLNGRLVGRLRRETSGAIDFQYDQSWLEWEHTFPVSLSLPLREDRYAGDPVFAVSDNLLPDNEDIRAASLPEAGGTVSTPTICWLRLAVTVLERCNSCRTMSIREKPGQSKRSRSVMPT